MYGGRPAMALHQGAGTTARSKGYLGQFNIRTIIPSTGIHIIKIKWF